MCEPVLLQYTSIEVEENIELTTQPTIQMIFFLWCAKCTSTKLLQATEGLQDSPSLSFTPPSQNNTVTSLPSVI